MGWALIRLKLCSNCFNRHNMVGGRGRGREEGGKRGGEGGREGGR